MGGFPCFSLMGFRVRGCYIGNSGNCHMLIWEVAVEIKVESIDKSSPSIIRM